MVEEFDMDNLSGMGYSSCIKVVTSNFLELEVKQIKFTLKLGNVLRFPRYTYKNRFIDTLVNNKTVKLLVVKAEKKLIVVEKKVLCC